MGVRNLWDILESCKKTLPLHHLQNKRVCIDLSCWLVQLHNVNKTHCALRSKLYLQCLFHRLRALIALNCSLILVTGASFLLLPFSLPKFRYRYFSALCHSVVQLIGITLLFDSTVNKNCVCYGLMLNFLSDGAIPSIKLSTYRRRLNVGTEVNEDERKADKVSSLRRNMGSEFSCMMKEAKILGYALGIPCLDGVEEAEAQCALLNSESLCDACYTSDSDAFLFGARTVYRDICLADGGYVVCYEMADIERKLGFGRNSLISLAVFLGGDYSQGVHGVGREAAFQILKSVDDNSVLQQIASEGLPFLKKAKGSKKQAKITGVNQEGDANRTEIDLQRNKEFIQVIDAYLKPKCHQADSDAVNRVLGVYPFNRHQLQQRCTQFFDWSPEKTDEYILPRIAERELRRYANLRCTSSKAGVKIPMDEMAVKCPVSSILKQRKLQGRDCFEVSWEDMHGLKKSVVPADLIESACPEKILEFQEERAQGKKRNQRIRRPKKSEDELLVKDIDLKLQKLLLDIENENQDEEAARFPGGLTAGKSVALSGPDISTQEQHLESALESKAGQISSSGCKLFPSLSEPEVIDLSTPLPIKVSSTSKRLGGVVDVVDIIDLSESENETSPDHARKARELRLFIARIGDH